MMQSNIFAKAAPLLREREPEINIDGTINFLSYYQQNDYIYPNALQRSLKISAKKAYSILEVCTEAGLVEPCLEVYCPRCKKMTGQIYLTMADVPDEVYCPHCDDEIVTPLKHVIVIYRVAGIGRDRTKAIR